MDFEKTFQALVEKLAGWLDSLIIMLPNLVVALLVVVLFALAARIVRKLVSKILSKTTNNIQITNLLATIAYIVVLIAGVFVALGVMQLDKTVTSLIAGVGIIGLALGFAFQDLAANFMAGILMSIRRPFKVSDIIETHDYFGTVQEIDLRATKLRTPQGQIVLLPNKEVFESPIVNYSVTGQRRIDLDVGVSYGDDLDKAARIAVEAVEAIELRNKTRKIELFYKEFGSSSINFVIRFWIDFEKQTDFLIARSDAIKKIKAAFDANDITIPFPIRTLDFGIVGGEKLSDVMPVGFATQNDR